MLERQTRSDSDKLKLQLKLKHNRALKDRLRVIRVRPKAISKTAPDHHCHPSATEVLMANLKVNMDNQVAWFTLSRVTATCTINSTRIRHMASSQARFTSNVSEPVSIKVPDSDHFAANQQYH